MSTKWTMQIQDIFTAAKLMALISIIAAGLYHMGAGKKSVSELVFHFFWANEVFCLFSVFEHIHMFAISEFNFLNLVFIRFKIYL